MTIPKSNQLEPFSQLENKLTFEQMKELYGIQEKLLSSFLKKTGTRIPRLIMESLEEIVSILFKEEEGNL
jgi:hypothetical protein